MKQEQLFSKRPPIDQLKELAYDVNIEQLPNIPDTPFILLPPPEYSLTKNIFQVYDEEQSLVNLALKDKRINSDLIGKTQTALGIKRRHKDFFDKSVSNLNDADELNDNESKNEDIKLTSKKRFRSEHEADELGAVSIKDDNNDLFNEDEMEVESMKDVNKEDIGSEGEEEEQHSSQVYHEERGNDFNLNFTEGYYNFK